MLKKHRSHSFAVLAHKESQYLEGCILSLINQTFKSNIVIYTSHPSQVIVGISEKYKIPLVINKDRRGIASDWSFAYNGCTSDYVTLVHQDDIYLPRYSELCFEAIDRVKKEDVLIAFTWYNDLIEKKERLFNANFIIKKLLLLPFMAKPVIRNRFLKKAVLAFGNPIPCPSVMFHKARIGAFDFSEEYNCNMDWDAWLRLSGNAGSFVFVNKKLLLHRVYKGSQTSSQIDNSGRKKEDLAIFRSLWCDPLAKLLSYAYHLSYRANNVKYTE